MKRQILSFISAAALAAFLSPAAHPQHTSGSLHVRAKRHSQLTNQSQKVNKAQARIDAAEMVPARAYLQKTIDAESTYAGQQFRVRLGQNVQLKNGPDLPRGTVLVGRVTQDRRGADYVMLALRFTQARLRTGKTVPIKAMMVSISQPHSMYIGARRGPARDLWNPHIYQVDQIGAAHGADMLSTITGKNSAIISSDKQNDVWINRGSLIDLAIARQPQGYQGGHTSGETPSM